MLNFKKIIYIILSLSLFILSCSSKKEIKENELIVSVGSEPQTMDPSKNQTVDGTIYISHIFEGLLTHGKNGNIEAAAAYAWDKSDSYYIFYLRTNAKWHDGKDVTASDFVYAFQRKLDPKTGAITAANFDMIKNASKVLEGEMSPEELGVYALDDYTLKIEFDYPLNYFEEVIADFTPLRKDIVSQNEDGWTLSDNTYIGNGAFKLAEWDHNNKIVVEKYADYWNADLIAPNKITFMLIEDINTAIAGIYNGELYFYKECPPSEKQKLIEDGYLITHSKQGLYYIEFNTKKEPYDNPLVRRALGLAIDKEYIADVVMQGSVMPANGLIPYSVMLGKNEFREEAEKYYIESGKNYANDIKEAKKLLAMAGYENGEGFPVIEFTTNPGIHATIAEAIQSMWKDTLNIEMKINTLEWAVFLDTMVSGDFEVGKQTWISRYPFGYLRLLKSGDIYNEGKYENAKYDELLKLSVMGHDEYMKNESMLKAEEVAMNEMPFIPIYYYQGSVMQNKNLKDVIYDNGYHKFHYAKIVIN